MSDQPSDQANRDDLPEDVARLSDIDDDLRSGLANLAGQSADPHDLPHLRLMQLLREVWPKRDTAENANTRAHSDANSNSSIGRYAVLRQIGVGSFGAVYLAHDALLNRDVAIKIINPGSLSEPEAYQRVVREREFVARLNHPNVVAALDAGESEGLAYLVNEYVPGSNLQDWLGAWQRRERGGYAFPIETALNWVWQLADAVDHSHSRGIIHRDIKPENILLQPPVSPVEDAAAATTRQTDPALSLDEASAVDVLEFCPDELIPKLTDFGLARAAEGRATGTRANLFVGTVDYASPEQLLCLKDKIGTTTDIYALGVVLYELLTGRLPHDRHSDFQQANKDLFKPVTRPSALRSIVSRDADAVVLKCLQVDAANRYNSAAELRADLGRLQKGLPVAARHTSTVEHIVRWCRRSPVLASMVVVCIVSLLSAAVGLVIANETLRQLGQRQQQSLQETQTFNAKLHKAFEDSQQLTQIAQRTSYLSQMNLAFQCWSESKWFEARRHLKQAKQALSDPSRVGLEWQLLDQQLSSVYQQVMRTESLVTEILTAPNDKHHIYVCQESGQLLKLRSTDYGIVTSCQLFPNLFAAAFSPDGMVLYAGGKTSNGSGPTGVYAWQMPELKHNRLISSFASNVEAIRALPDNQSIVVGPRYNDIQVVSLTDEARLTLATDRRNDAIALSPNAKQVAFFGRNELRIGDVTDGKIVATWRLPTAGSQIIWDAKSSHILPTMGGHMLDIEPSWNSESATEANHDLSSHSALDSRHTAINAIAQNNDTVALATDRGDLLIADDAMQLCLLFAGESSQEPTMATKSGYSSTNRKWLQALEGACSAMAFSGEDGLMLADREKNLVVVRVGSDSVLHTTRPGHVSQLSWRDDEHALEVYSGSGNATSLSLDSKQWESLTTPMDHAVGKSATASPLSACFDAQGNVSFYAQKLQPVGQMTVPTARPVAMPVRAVALCQNKPWALMTGDNRWIITWDVERSEMIWRHRLGDSGRSIAIDEVSDTVLVGGDFEKLQLIRITDGTVLTEIEAGNGSRSVVFDRLRGRYISGHIDGAVRIWSQDLSTCIAVCRGHDASIGDLALSPDGSLLASAGLEGEVRLWDAETGAAFGVLARFPPSMASAKLSFSPHSSKLAVAFSVETDGKAQSFLHIWPTIASSSVEVQ